MYLASSVSLLIIGAVYFNLLGGGQGAMKERKGVVTMDGKPLMLVGNELKVGDAVPDCEVVGKDLVPVKLSSFRGKVCIISSLPSLDTSVCDIMTRRFSEEAVALGKDVMGLAKISLNRLKIEHCHRKTVYFHLTKSKYRG